MSVRKHYVTFYSPGTFYPEQSTKPIGEYDTKEAVRMSKEVLERYNAKPHSFRFTTYIEVEDVPDGEGGFSKVEPKKVGESCTYYLGGRVRTIDEVKIKACKEERILLSNMECNKEYVLIENTNSYRHTGFFYEKDCIVDDEGTIVRRGNDPDLMAIRNKEQ